MDSNSTSYRTILTMPITLCLSSSSSSSPVGSYSWSGKSPPHRPAANPDTAAKVMISGTTSDITWRE
eukprot:CAMPEP_0180255388 /NCGR_PEP_ID=MMETSP0987-20121128/40695_1 /TAXON_ID=697907 /ORGANISM="non described non described, Strain CCMP2293" /LENGTH=66 /DNA_ID=CAMNT_0022224495 /DNA_START=1 /DNA_END=201 /DNA_ORIENTATION=+